jgi:hypothetical protein
MAAHLRNRRRFADLHRIFTIACRGERASSNSEREAFYDARAAIKDVAGFFGDLAATRRAVAQDNRDRLAQGAPESAIDHEIRYALTESALRTFADNLTPRIMAGLVELGELSCEAAISTAMRAADWQRRFDQLSALIGVVPQQDIDALLAAARSALPNHRVADMLLLASNRLGTKAPPHWLEEVAGLIEREANPLHRCALIRKSADRLTPDRLAQLCDGVLDQLRTQDPEPLYPNPWTTWLAILCQILPIDAGPAAQGRDPLLGAVLEIDARVEQLGGSLEVLLALLKRNIHDAVNDRLVESACARADGKVNWMYRLASVTTGAHRERAMDLAAQAVRRDGIANALVDLTVPVPPDHHELFERELATQLMASPAEGFEPGSERYELARAWPSLLSAVSEACRVENRSSALRDARCLTDDDKPRTLAELARFFTGAEYDEVATEVTQGSASIEDAVERCNVLSVLARGAPPTTRVGLYRIALSAAFAISDPRKWTAAVEGLLEDFPEEGLEQLCDELVENSRGGTKTVLVSRLLPRLRGEPKTRAILSAFHASQSIDDPNEELDAIIAIVAALRLGGPGDRVDQMNALIDAAVEAARAIMNPKERALAFARVFSVRQELARIMGVEALDAAGAINSHNCAPYIPDQMRGMALRALAPHLSGDHWARCEQMADQLEDPLWRAWVQVALRRSAQGGKRHATALRATKEARRIQSGLRGAEALVDLAGEMRGLLRSWILEAAIVRARETRDGADRACALGMLLKHLAPDRAAAVVREIQTNLELVTQAEHRINVQSWLLTAGSPEEQRRALDDLLALVANAQPTKCTAALVLVANRCPPARQAEIIEQLIVSLNEIDSVSDQAFYLQDLSPSIVEAHRTTLYPELSRMLNVGASLGRSALLSVVTKLLPALVSICGPRSRAEVPLAVWDAVRRWSNQDTTRAEAGAMKDAPTRASASM